MAFSEELDELLAKVDGALVCSVMGFDGIAIESRKAEVREGVAPPAGPSEEELATLFIEYGMIFGRLKEAAQALQLGGIEEVSISSERLTIVARFLTSEFFLVLAFVPSANFGKARYLMKLAVPNLRAELQ